MNHGKGIDAGKMKDSQGLNQFISHVWDKNVLIRARDLEQETDITYTKVIKPWVLGELQRIATRESSILDIGSGCGYLANAVYTSGFANITGIDISEYSVKYSKERYPYIKFYMQDIYTLVAPCAYDFVLAVMSINNMPKLLEFFQCIKDLLRPGGGLLMVIPHPCFWPYKHIKDEIFHYEQERSYELLFSTKGEKNYSSKILYFHRRLEMYFEAINSTGLQVESCHELVEIEGEDKPDIMGFIIKNPN